MSSYHQYGKFRVKVGPVITTDGTLAKLKVPALNGGGHPTGMDHMPAEFGLAYAG